MRESQDELQAAILAAWHAASEADRAAGRRWYQTAGRIIAELADWSGLAPDRMAAVVAALSPRNAWGYNVADAAAIAHAAVNGRPADSVSVTTFGANRDRAYAIACGGAEWSGAALKVRSFVANMTGSTDDVTVDVWAVRVATAGRRDGVKSEADYRNIRDAYRAVAASIGEAPSALQATVWVAAQDTAARVKSNRIKRGTLPIVVALLTGAAS